MNASAKSKKKLHWRDFMWIASALYLILGFVNILFAWLGLFCFFIPIILSVSRKDKAYCNRYCGRGQLFALLGQKLKLSRNKPIPRFLRSKWFRYGFLTFFMLMFFQCCSPHTWYLQAAVPYRKASSCCGASACPGNGPILSPLALPG